MNHSYSCEPPGTYSNSFLPLTCCTPMLHNSRLLLLLMHRFVESIRHQKRGLTVDNVELGQRMPLSVGQQTDDLIIKDVSRPDEKPTTLPAQHAYLLRAPDRPTQFQVVQGRDVLLLAQLISPMSAKLIPRLHDWFGSGTGAAKDRGPQQ